MPGSPKTRWAWEISIMMRKIVFYCGIHLQKFLRINVKESNKIERNEKMGN
jgi:hypothetical protein